METQKTANDIRTRFNEEQEHIWMFVGYLSKTTAITCNQIEQLNATLSEFTIPEWTEVVEKGTVVSADMVPDLMKWANSVSPLVDEAARKQTAIANEVRDDYRKHVPREIAESDLVDKAYGMLQGNLEKESVERVTRELTTDIISNYFDDHYQLSPEMAATVAVDQAVCLSIIMKELAIQQAKRTLYELTYLGKVQHSGTNLHVFRQGFILLMTAFDATVSDLFRVACRKRFFKLISMFGGKEQVSLDDFARAGNLESLQNQIIEKQLKKRYLKDLLGVLESQKVQCADPAYDEGTIDLFEMVQRRNLHVHNRGNVDARYLETDQEGKSKYNIYNLKLGDTAQIDEDYWKKATRMTYYCVEQIARWADGD